VGPSGSGKSTLLDLLAGERAPDDGLVATLPRAVMGQRTEQFRDTLAENLRLAAPGADDDALAAALARAGLADVAEALPDGLATPFGEGGTGLSAGQRRLLSLARMLLRDAPLRLLDEPTEGLDGPRARAVLDGIAAQAGRRTLVVVTHLRREAGLADRLVRLERGRIVADVRRGEPRFAEILEELRPD